MAMNLNNASISSKSSAALYVIRAKNVYLSTEENTVNRLSTEGEFVQTDGNSVDAAIFSKADLFLTGGGELQVNCAYGHGIVSKDDLEISSGTYAVSASSKGIYGKDSVEIFGGTISIQAGTDGIASENTEDTEKGSITIAGGSISMDCGRDGIDASGKILIEDGSFGAMGGMHGGTGKGNRGQMPEGDTGTFPGGMPEGEKGGLPSDMPGGDRGSFGGRA